jgi:hypothetical protein
VADNPPFISPADRAALDDTLEHVQAQLARKSGYPGRQAVQKEQAQRRAEIEKQQPQSLWKMAQSASQADWTVHVCRRPEGWALILGDPHHCIHVEWIPSTDDRFPGKIWRLAHREFRTRCPFGDKVRIEDLREWMRTHPADCAARRAFEGVKRPPIGELDYLPKSCTMRHPHPGVWTGPHSNPRSIANDPSQGGDDV